MPNIHHIPGTTPILGCRSEELRIRPRPWGFRGRRLLAFVAVLAAVSCASVFILASPAAYGADGDAASDPAATPAPAADATPGDAKVGFKKTEVSAVAASLLQYQKDSRKALINFKWDLLPESPQFDDIVAWSSEQVQEMVLTNADLGNGADGKPKWLAHLSPEMRTELGQALYPSGKNGLNDFTASASDDDFMTYWQKDETKGLGFATGVNGALLNSRNYYSILRDHYLLTAFLGGHGIGYVVKISGAIPTRGPLIKSTGEDVQWRVKLIHIPGSYNALSSSTPGAPVVSTSLPAYRVAITAELKRPIDLTFSPDTTGTDAQMRITIGFRRSDGTDGLDINNDFLLAGKLEDVNMAPVKLPDDTTDNIAALNERAAGNRLDTVLANVGGSSINELVVKGLLGGTQNSSIITGGLVGAGKVDKVFGVNIERSPAAKTSVGVMLGVVPDHDNSLFVGPTLRTSILTLGAGMRAYETDKGNGQTSVHARPAGVLSVDLSRLTRQKVPATSFVLGNTDAGGGWGQATDDIAANLQFVSWNLTAVPNLALSEDDKKITWEFRQVKDALGADIAPAKQAVFTFTMVDFVNAYTKHQFIPTGTYHISGGGGKYSLGPGSGIHSLAGRFASMDVSVNAKSHQALTYFVRPAPSVPEAAAPETAVPLVPPAPVAGPVAGP